VGRKGGIILEADRSEAIVGLDHPGGRQGRRLELSDVPQPHSTHGGHTGDSGSGNGAGWSGRG